MNALETATRWKLAVTLGVLTVSICVVARSAHRDTRYFMVGQLVEEGLARHDGEVVRVHGYVMAGTIVGDDVGRSFVLQQDGKQLRVFARGPLPDRFKDQVEVVVTGELVPGHQLADAARRLRLAPDDSYALESSALIMRCTDWRERYVRPDNVFR